MADESTPETEKAAETLATAEAEALRAEVADLKNKLLRSLAEMENLRKRTEREISDARQYAVANFARDVLTVGDNLRRAIDAVPKDAGKSDPALAALIEGVDVTERGLQQSLQKFGVKRVETKGQKFDPGIHQAMLEIETGDVDPGAVAEEIQAGYVIGDRVLRPALVAVAKRGAKPPPAANDDESKVSAAPEGPES